MRPIISTVVGGVLGMFVFAWLANGMPWQGDWLCNWFMVFGAAAGLAWELYGSPWLFPPERFVRHGRTERVALKGDLPHERHFAPAEDESLPQLAFLVGRSLRPFARLLRPQRHALPLLVRVAHCALGGLLLGWCFHAAILDAPFVAAQQLNAMLIASLAAGFALGIAWAVTSSVEVAAGGNTAGLCGFKEERTLISANLR